jgi:hypothetical protein
MLEEDVDEALGAAGGTRAWLINTAVSAVARARHRRTRGGGHAPDGTHAPDELDCSRSCSVGDELGDAGGVVRQGTPGFRAARNRRRTPGVFIDATT